MELTMTHLRYLLTIYAQAEGASSVSAVARKLGVSKPSVTRMLGILAEKGLVTQERYGKVLLTAAGQSAARRQLERAARLRELLPRLGLRLTAQELEAAAFLLAAALPKHALPARDRDDDGPPAEED